MSGLKRCRPAPRDLLNGNGATRPFKFYFISRLPLVAICSFEGLTVLIVRGRNIQFSSMSMK